MKKRVLKNQSCRLRASEERVSEYVEILSKMILLPLLIALGLINSEGCSFNDFIQTIEVAIIVHIRAIAVEVMA